MTEKSCVIKDGASSCFRVAWVDAVKLFACLLVVLGHLFMSMVASGLLDEGSSWYQFAIQTIYSFHVPLFFVCSGFLYQFNHGRSTLESHFTSIRRKALALGVPYVTFSALTLLLKIVFSAEVNNQATPFLRTLLFEPIAPYWYLYTLLILFCLIPRLDTIKGALRLFIATFVMKLIYVCIPLCWNLPDLVQKVAACAVWFTFGMLIANTAVRNVIMSKKVGICAMCLALALSFGSYRVENSDHILQFLLAMLFVYSIIAFAVAAKEPENHVGLLSKMSAYFMPVYVLHTICAASARTVLLKLGVDSLCLNLIAGVVASIGIPIAIYRISLSHWWMLFFFEPARALKQKEGKDEQTS